MIRLRVESKALKSKSRLTCPGGGDDLVSTLTESIHLLNSLASYLAIDACLLAS